MWPIVIGAAIATLWFGNAKAEVYVTENKSGGEIVLTDRQCTFKGEVYEGLFEAYVWSPTAPMEKGCWTMVDKMVHVVYQGKGDRRVYDPNLFRKK